MNNVMLAHIGGEVVAMAGIFYFFYRKTGQLEEQINLLKAQNEELIKVIESLGQDLQKVYSIVTGSRGAPPPPSHSQTVPKRSTPKKKAKKPEPESGDETVNEDELDDIVNLELQSQNTPLPTSQAKRPPKRSPGVTTRSAGVEVCELIDD
jgi:hypothetical protein